MIGARRNILVVGYGEMGHAMEQLLGRQHHLHIWKCEPENDIEPRDLAGMVAESDFIFFCVPAAPIADLAQRILPALSHHSISLSIAKGLDHQGRTAAQIFQDVYGEQIHYGVLYGPMISEEIRANRPAFAQLGIGDKELYEKVTSLFHDTALYLEHTTDIRGVSWSAVLKNVYAILFGVADELGLGDNTRGYLTVAAMHEMDAIVTALGGSIATSHHLAGLGDLITTATSAGSHHHELGRLLVRGQINAIQGEGVHTLAMVKKHSLFDMGCYPLFSLAHQMIQSPTDIEEKFQEYLTGIYRKRRNGSA